MRGPRKGIGVLELSPDGTRLAASSADKTVRLWDTAAGQELFILRGHQFQPTYLAFSPDGRRLASVGHTDQTVRLWDVADGRLLAVLAHADAAQQAVFSPKGDRVLTCEMYPSNAVRLWNAA
jgi:WD40 repeat protein